MQVWIKDRCVGEMSVAVGEGYRSYDVVMPDETDDDDWNTAGNFYPPGLKRLRLPIARRATAFNEIDVVRHGEELLRQLCGARHVPANARLSRDPADTRYVFDWDVFEVDLDTYERIFDLDTFEPL